MLSDSIEHRVVVVAVTETPSAFQRQMTRAADETFLRPALGLHPLRAGGLPGSEVQSFFASMGRTDYVGEIGIDRSRHGKPTESRQIQLFERVLAEPRIKEKVLTIHSRGAAKEVVDRMEQASVVGIMHWYTGSLSVAERALAAGLYFSINPSMVRSKAGKRLLQVLPKDRVLTETDGPYCRVDSRESTPSDIPRLVGSLADLWELSDAKAAKVIVENMSRLYSQVTGPPRSVGRPLP